jgi:hypothetical protein
MGPELLELELVDVVAEYYYSSSPDRPNPLLLPGQAYMYYWGSVFKKILLQIS